MTSVLLFSHTVPFTCSPFITLSLGPIGMGHVISELCYRGTVLQRNYRKMNILWSFFYNSFVKFHGKKIGTALYPNPCYMRCVIKGN